MVDVSVIIPAKNEEKNIGVCLESVFSSTFPENRFEVLVVDNGSEDSTVEIAKSKGAEVFQIPGVKISSLRNFGAEKAKGRLLAFIDADCTVSEDWLEKACRYIERDDIACFGSPPSIPENPTWVQSAWFNVRKKPNEIMETPWLESMNMFVKKETFLNSGGFNEELITCEDVDFSYRISNYGKILSDLGIKAVHHGEAKTVREFFRKERWRGKSNYHGLFSHGLRFDELPSLLLPLYFGLMPIILITQAILFSNLLVSLTLIILWQLPVLLVTSLKLRNRFRLRSFLRLFSLYNVYYVARFLAVIY